MSRFVFNLCRPTGTRVWHAVLRGVALGTMLCAGRGFAAGLPHLDSAILSATATAQTVLHVPDFGHYTIIASSDQGVALQLVDHMRGPGPIQGQPGKQDGRLDLFLEKGDYLLKTLASPRGNGKVKLSIYRAHELSPSPAPRLVRFRLFRGTLNDLQQRSFWLQVKTRRTVAIEAAGRNLADLRLWKDGNWLVDAQPRDEVTTPSKGKPLDSRLLVAQLNPGLYLLTAYGGPPQPWEHTSSEHPFYLRMGIPELAAAGRRRYIASPFGIDRWRLPGDANYFRIELATAESASLSVDVFNADRPFASSGATATIDKKSLPPVAELNASYGSEQVVTIHREAGKPYIFQHFRTRDYIELSSPGQYWLGSVHSGYGEDHIDTTALLAKTGDYEQWQFVDSSAITLDGKTGWQRRFNLLGKATLFIHVKSNGIYNFTVDGVRAYLRLEPFMINPPRDFRLPQEKYLRISQYLDPGYYLLSIRPDSGDNGKGIATLSAGPATNGPDHVVATTQPAAQTAYHTILKVQPDTYYRLYLNRQPGVTAGIIMRPVPVDISDALPISQAAGETINLDIRVPEAGTVTAVAEDGRRLPFSVDSGSEMKSMLLKPGSYAFSLHNDGNHAVDYALTLTPSRLDSDMPLPPIAGDVLDSRPEFPVLDVKHPYFYDTERNQDTTLNIHVAKPALYRLESTGLLRTQGKLRTRTITDLVTQAANGVGRNFLIAQYLGEGEYQLTMRPLGASMGHFGVRLAQNTPVDGGILKLEIPSRHTLQAGEGLLYRFHIPVAGDYTLRALGLGRQFSARLEDGDGWPLVQPGVTANFHRHFAAGDYRLVILPQQVTARVVTLLSAVKAAPDYQGHGPHQIALNQTVRHRWMEPNKGEARVPDQWRFTVPADTGVRIDLTAKMSATLLYDGTKVADFTGGESWRGNLVAGDYVLQVESRRPNNRFDYRVGIFSDALVSGETRMISAPADLVVAIGSDDPFELYSFGAQDVRAQLYDKDGKMIAQNDDRLDDWNFFISQQLAPGHYRLHIDPVGSVTAATAVTLRLPTIRQDKALELPAKFQVTDTDLHYFPLPSGHAGQLWGFMARSRDNVGIALERQVRGQWQTVGQRTGIRPLLVVPSIAAKAGEFRLRVWSVSRAGHPIEVVGSRLSIPHNSESQLDSGINLTPVVAFDPPLGVAAVDLGASGQFTIPKGGDGLLWGSQPAQGLAPVVQGHLPASRGVLWLARPLQPGSSRRITAKRMILDGKDMLSFGLQPDSRAALDLSSLHSSSTQLVLAESPTSLPGIGAWSAAPLTTQVGVARHSVVMLRHGRQWHSVVLWDTAHQRVVMPVQLHLFSYRTGSATRLTEGSHDLALSPLQAQRLSLPVGRKHLRIAVPAGVAVELRRNGMTLATFWSGSAAASFADDSVADQLIVYNTRSDAGHVGLLVIASSSASSQLTSAHFGKYHFADGGSDLIEVRLGAGEKDAGRWLHVEGKQSAVTAIEASGRILRGLTLLLHDDAQVLIDHGPGFVLAWLSDTDGNTAIGAGLSQRRVKLPAHLALEGSAVSLRLTLPHAEGMTLSSDIPLIVRVRAPGQPERLRLFRNAVDLPLYLPAGENTLHLDSTTASPLGGHVDIHRVDVDALSHGMGPMRMLAPGDSRLYHFHLAQPRTVGLGVKASVDIVSCTLLDAMGTEIGRGLLQMHDLDAGDYLLRVEAPPDGETVQVQAVVVGDQPPDSGPPKEVIRKYLRAAGLKSE